jgi:hypothetical protein
MERMFIFVMILWLAAFETAHAQVSPQLSPPLSSGPSTAVPSSMTGGATQAGPGGTGLTQTPCSISSTLVGGAATAPGCASDPLSVPSFNVPGSSAISPAGSTTGAATGSTSGTISASPSINPQTAAQLPGEAPNTAKEGPITTASQPGAASTALCHPAIPSTAGALSPGDLFGAISPSGC